MTHMKYTSHPIPQKTTPRCQVPIFQPRQHHGEDLSRNNVAGVFDTVLEGQVVEAFDMETVPPLTWHQGLNIWVVVSNIFGIFTPKIGEDFQFDDHIFQMG